MGQNHHFIVTDVKNGSVDSVDGNAGASMEILTNNYQISNVLKAADFIRRSGRIAVGQIAEVRTPEQAVCRPGKELFPETIRTAAR